MSKRVYDGFRRTKPNDIKLQKGWLYPVEVTIPEHLEQIYGADVIYTIFKG